MLAVFVVVFLLIVLGIAAAAVGLRREFKDGEGHSLANLAGLILILIAVGVFDSQIIIATVWK